MLLTAPVDYIMRVQARGVPCASWARTSFASGVSAVLPQGFAVLLWHGHNHTHARHYGNPCDGLPAALPPCCSRDVHAERRPCAVWLWYVAVLLADVLSVCTAEPSSGSMPQVSAQAFLLAVISLCCVPAMPSFAAVVWHCGIQV